MIIPPIEYSQPALGRLAVCALFRNEAPYLDEWLRFHLHVGVEHFFLYDNNSDDGPTPVLAPYLKADRVSLRAWPTPFHQGAQRKAYADCLAVARGRFRWVAFIDLDEFLFSPTGLALPQVLAGLEAHCGVVVHWQCYGSAGQQQMHHAPVTERFTWRAPTHWVRNRKVKSIVDPERALEPISVHHFRYRNDQQAVDENGWTVRFKPKPRFKRKAKRLYGTLWPWLGPILRRLPIDPYRGAEIDRPRLSVSRLRINHYAVKSRAEFQQKAQLKQERRRYDDLDYFAFHDRNDIDDPILADMGRALLQK